MKQNKKWIFFLLMAGLSACIDNPIDQNVTPEEEIVQDTHELGQNRFVSGEETYFGDSYENGNNAYQNNGSTNGGDDGAVGDERVAEEGDIYRVSQNEGIILNLNPYRGLQLIDFSDPTNPEIIGQAQISGEPVEMYQVGNFVYILMNNWWGYYANQAIGGADDRFNGGVIAVVDISDQSNPQIIKRQQVEGDISTSRVTRGNDRESLYTASNRGGETFVTSFSISQTGDLTEKGEIALGGYVSDIQATGTHLLVAREAYDGGDDTYGSKVAVIDIGDENGQMVEGASVDVEGFVSKKSDMSFRGDILRVVSGNTWSSDTNTNHVETFNYSDLQNPTKVDGESFGDGEDLFATLFLENSAFFVTFEQVDPFHSFSISDAGDLVEESEFIVSGFNTWFRPVSDNTRLIGIGVDDKNGNRSPAVSLYDIEDLKNANPLVDREEVTTSWSDAIWDDKSFSVIEKGTSVMSENGVLETGIVLLPFQGWDDDSDSYRTGVQIFSFSDSTLTKRGVMLHDTPVVRTFAADPSKDLTGNLSNLELSLFNTADIDAPVEVSRLALAPNYDKALPYGNYIARRQNRAVYWNWWGSNGTNIRYDAIDIVPKSNLEDRNPIAEITVPSGSTLNKKGDLLIAHSQDDDDIVLSVWDLSDPTSPTLRDSFTTDTIPRPESNYYGYDDYYEGEDCYDCYYEQDTPSSLVGDALIFHSDRVVRDKIGTLTRTSQRLDYNYPGSCSNGSCSYDWGYRECTQLELNDGTRFPKECDEYFQRCTVDSDYNESCTEISAPSNLETETSQSEVYRGRTLRDLHVIDLSNPDDIKLGATISNTGNFVSSVTEDNLYHLSYKVLGPITHPSRNFAAHYFRTYDFSDPSNVSVSSSVNIPGHLIAVDGNKIFTKDFLWAPDGLDDVINRLEVSNGQATLDGVKRFDDRYLYLNGKVEIEDEKFYLPTFGYDVNLTVYPLVGDFTPLAELELHSWIYMQEVVNGRAIFDTDGGVLVVNMTDLANPFPQAFLPMRGWSSDSILDGDSLIVAAGLYGIYNFDITTTNLSQP